MIKYGSCVVCGAFLDASLYHLCPGFQPVQTGQWSTIGVSFTPSKELELRAKIDDLETALAEMAEERDRFKELYDAAFDEQQAFETEMLAFLCEVANEVACNCDDGGARDCIDVCAKSEAWRMAKALGAELALPGLRDDEDSNILKRWIQ